MEKYVSKIGVWVGNNTLSYFCTSILVGVEEYTKSGFSRGHEYGHMFLSVEERKGDQKIDQEELKAPYKATR